MRSFDMLRKKILAFAGTLIIKSIFIPAAGASGLSAMRNSLADTSGMQFSYSVKPWYKHRRDGRPGREIIIYPGSPHLWQKARLISECEGVTERLDLLPGMAGDSLSVLLPPGAGTDPAIARITLESAGGRYSRVVPVPPKKQWTVYIYPHSHVDIGYTDLQETVEKLHVRNIDVAIDIARKTQNYPEGARFVWNPEAMWVVSSYLKTADATRKRSFIEAVRKGWIKLDGAFANMNTSICSDEELLKIFNDCNAVEELTGVPVKTLVQVDNPGAAWGLVQAASQKGITGFLSFPNYYDLRHSIEHKPFYWTGPDGKSRIFFLQGSPYGYGYLAKGSKYGLARVQSFSSAYDRLSTDAPLSDFIDPFIFRETEKLEKAGSPYDIFAMTWSMADNCLIDADLPEAVKLWNGIYAYPKVIIAGADDIVNAYEKKYADVIPEYRGDFTEFWTNGLGSDARRVGMARRAKENIVQAQALHALLRSPGKATADTFDVVWQHLLLAAEHTWGYQDPRAPLAKQVEANKAAFFSGALKGSEDLIASAVPVGEEDGEDAIAVINTLSWGRDGLVWLPAAQSQAGDRVIDGQKREMPSQRLSSGELIFRTGIIPPFGASMYRVVRGRSRSSRGVWTKNAGLRNKLLSVQVDRRTGDIISLKDLKNGRELVRPADTVHLNSYRYVSGVYNGKSDITGIGGPANVRLKIGESGPLLVSLIVTSDAPGCRKLIREITVAADEPVIRLKNTVDKIGIKEKEGIHFGYAFGIPGGKIRMDIPLGVMEPGKDQLPWANRNWFAFQRWIDISNEDYGVTWTSVESPLVELGGITGTILDGARQADRWLKKVPETQTIFSWMLNNHWDTNFPLSQEGRVSSSAMIRLHGPFRASESNRFGVEQHRPLIALPAGSDPLKKAPVYIDNPEIMVSALKISEDGKGIILRLRSLSASPESVQLEWPGELPGSVFICGPDEKPLEEYKGSFVMNPYGLTSFRIE